LQNLGDVRHPRWPSLKLAQAKAICLAAAGLLGCSTEATITPTAKSQTDQLAFRDDLTLALDGLRKMAQAPDEQSSQRTVFYFNQWLATAKPAKGEWKPDRMLENLPLALRRTPGLEHLDRLEFGLFDLRHLQANLWANDIAQRARKTQVSPELAQWLKQVEQKVGVTEAEQLAAAERMFDWTVRNIQLDPLPPPPKGPVATAGGTGDPVAPAALGELGPGYRHLPLEILVQGRGDALERARVFILLCRQLNIDAVMLGLMEEQSPAPRGWLPAVLLQGELYLFETSLGLPIPGPEGKGIATLAQVIADPQLLRRLDVEGATYPVAEEDLKVTGLIDADPDALSRRMQLLQAALPSGQHLILTTRPSVLEPKLRQCKGIGPVSLWRVPFEAVLYQYGRLQVASQNEAASRALQLELSMFDPNYALYKGRNLHLQGRFEKQDQEPGARALYLSSRPPEQDMVALETSEVVRKAQGLQQSLPADPQQQKEAIDFITTTARTRKHHATYWLGLTYQEAGNHPAAIEWLAERTMEAYPPSPWIPGARYNLARCYEDLGQWEAARKWLESDKESPQRHGNLLRAKWIAQQHAGTADTPQSEPAGKTSEPTASATD
jgi:hypothetical protein